MGCKIIVFLLQPKYFLLLVKFSFLYVRVKYENTTCVCIHCFIGDGTNLLALKTNVNRLCTKKIIVKLCENEII